MDVVTHWMLTGPQVRFVVVRVKVAGNGSNSNGCGVMSVSCTQLQPAMFPSLSVFTSHDLLEHAPVVQGCPV